MAPYEELQEHVIKGDQDSVKKIVRALLEGGGDPMKIISEGLTAALSVVGGKMSTGEMFIPEVLASAHAVRAGMELLKPAISADRQLDIYVGKFMIGTVQGDVHDIGKKIVSLLLESGGFRVIDLGVDVPADRFIEAVKKEQPNILGLSALLTTTVPRMKEVIEALTSSNLRDKVRVMVGGAPVTQAFADSIGADGYSPDAGSALSKAKRLLSKP